MKMNRTLLIVLVTTFSATLQSMAQPSDTVAFSHLEKSDALIGMIVTDPHNERVGRISELAIDWHGGRVAEVLVDTAGFLTTKQRIVAVPPESFVPANSSDQLRFNGDIDSFDNAPEFDISAWKEFTSESSVTDVYERFHVQPNSHFGSIVRAGKLMGLTVRNQRNERLAKVESLVVDLPSGRMPVVIIDSIGLLGRKGELTAVAPEAFYFQPDYNAVILDTSKEALKNAPHFKSSDWRKAVNETMSLSAIDDSLNVLRSLTADGMADQNMQTPSPGDANGVKDTDGQADARIALQIEHKIAVADGLSMDAHHVQVTVQRSRVTLRGLADSEKEKKQLGDIAASVVPANYVNNQVEVRIFAGATDP